MFIFKIYLKTRAWTENIIIGFKITHKNPAHVLRYLPFISEKVKVEIIV